jgi:hypothetical protein
MRTVLGGVSCKWNQTLPEQYGGRPTLHFPIVCELAKYALSSSRLENQIKLK